VRRNIFPDNAVRRDMEKGYVISFNGQEAFSAGWDIFPEKLRSG
jgi:hypothetical protein